MDVDNYIDIGTENEKDLDAEMDMDMDTEMNTDMDTDVVMDTKMDILYCLIGSLNRDYTRNGRVESIRILK
jgi:hypothetical protein